MRSSACFSELSHSWVHGQDVPPGQSVLFPFHGEPVEQDVYGSQGRFSSRDSHFCTSVSPCCSQQHPAEEAHVRVPQHGLLPLAGV